MDEKGEWVFRVLGFQVDGATGQQSTSQDEPLTREKLVAELRARIKEMVTEAKLLGDPEVVGAIGQKALHARDTIEKGDLTEAELAVDALETALAEAKAAARRKEVGGGKGGITYRKAQVEWRQARSVALTSVKTMTSELKSDSRITDDPESETLIQIIDTFPTLLPQFDSDLEEQLEALDSTTDPELRHSLVEEAKSTVAEYRALLSDVALLKLQDLGDSEPGKFDVIHTLEATLQRIDASLVA